jgi:hypothetical protein
VLDIMPILIVTAQVLIGLVVIFIPTFGFFFLGRKIAPNEIDPGLQWLIGLFVTIVVCVVLGVARAIGMGIVG